jgi:hypothetical protein
MIKSLEEIQQENRRLILETILEGNNLRLLKENIGDFSGARLDLSRVLLALTHKDISQAKPEIKFYNGYIITINGYPWDLTKETLEEQSEETQRTINELLTKK